RQFELDAATRTRATVEFERALREGQYLARAQLGKQLAHAGIAAKGVRLALLTVHAELEGVLCSGPRQGKDLTYGLLGLRAPRAQRLSLEKALAELPRSFFRSHGPATIRDFVWWSGLTTTDAKLGLDAIKGRHEVIDGLEYWTVDETH